MTIREKTEEAEYLTLSRFACRSRETLPRDIPEEKCIIRTEYQRDRDRILHSKAFRRLKDKTQVFLSPQGDHYRTRLTHTLEVSQIARTIARALKLNEDLVEAIALGHDLGHTPFGHEGETVLNRINPSGFVHCDQSVRVVEMLENGGKGLNLTKEVRDGILNHRSSGNPSTLEGQVVQISDKIAYIHHDMDDATRAGIITEDSIPVTLRIALGATAKERLNRLICDIIENSIDKPKICQSKEIKKAMLSMRKIMFERVYYGSEAKTENQKVERLLTALYEYYISRPEKMSSEYLELLKKGEDRSKVVCDYISGMTDQYAIHVFNELYEPRCWSRY